MVEDTNLLDQPGSFEGDVLGRFEGESIEEYEDRVSAMEPKKGETVVDFRKRLELIKRRWEEPKGEFQARKASIEEELAEASKILKEEKHINPLGEGSEVNSLVIVVGGDVHIPIAEPENIGAAAKPGPQRVVTKIAERIDRWRGRGKDWWMEGLQNLYFEVFLAKQEAVKEAIRQPQETAVLYVDTGDIAMPSGGKRDAEYTACVMAGLKRSIMGEVEAGGKNQQAYAFLLAGDHDIESKDHGARNFEKRSKLYGSQSFIQEVGPDEGGYLIVALETAFFDPKEERNFKRLGDSKKSAEEDREVWEAFQSQKKAQIELLEEAAKRAEKGRNVVLIGHELGIIRKMIRRPNGRVKKRALRGILPNVVQVVTGHYHTEKVMTEKGRKTIGLVSGFPVGEITNNRGEKVEVSIPQAATWGLAGLQFEEEPTIVKLAIRSGEPVGVKDIPINPERIEELLLLLSL